MSWRYNPVLGTDEWVEDPIAGGDIVTRPTHTVRGGNPGRGAGELGGQTGNTNPLTGVIDSGPLQHGQPGSEDTPPVIPGPAGIVQSPQDARSQTISAAGGYLPIAYGRAQYSGLITHLGTNAAGSSVVIGYSLGHGEIEKVVRVESYGYDDYGDRSDDTSFSRTWDSFECYHGTTSQTVNSTLAAVFGETSGFPGVAYAVASYALTLSGGEVSFPKFTVKGRKLYDPRENQIADSDLYTEASGWYDDGTFPTVATSVADPFGGTRAGRWTWGAGTHSIAHDGAATPASTDPVSVAVWLRVASGSLALTLRAHRNAEDDTEAITVDTVWRRFTVTLAAGASGGACAIAIDAVPASTVLEVFRAGIEINTAAAGPCYTSGAAINPTTAYSTNPALAMADLKTAEFAGRVASTSVNWRSVCEAADWCDEQISALPRFSFGMVFTGQERRSMRDCERTIGLHFGGRWQETNGTYSIVVNRPRSVSGSILEADIIGQPVCRRGTTAGLLDAPNRVTVEWTDPDDGWKTKPVSVQGAEVEAGLPIREGSAYPLHGCQTAQQARRHAIYILNGIEHDLAVSLVVQPKWLILEVGDRVQLTDSALGFSARDFSVIGFRRNEDGTVGLDLLEYSTDLWTEEADGGESGGGGGDGGGIGGGDVGVPDVTQPTIDDNFVLCWYPARTLDTATLYGSGAWSLTNVTSGDTAKVNDAVENVSAGTFASAADTTFRLDATTGKAFTAARIVLAAGGTKTWPIEFSDDDAAWTAVTADFRAALLSPAPYGFRAEWTLPSAHRYWRVRKGTSVAGSEDLYELQFYTSVIYPSSHHVEILNSSGTVIATASAGVGQVCVDLSAFAVLATDGLTKTLSITIKNVSISGAKSVGVALTHTTTVTSVDTTQAVVRMLAVDHATHTATWQLGCLYGDTTRYGSSYWALTNAGASPDLSKINDGVTNVKAFDANAAGATIATLDITGEPMAFCGVDFVVPSATKLFTDHTQSGTYPGSPSPTPGAGPLGVWAAEYWDGAAWVRPPQTLKTSTTVVTYSQAGIPGDYPSQGWTADKYQITANRIRIEWDPQLYSTARAKWRITQTTTDAIALDVYEIQWLTFVRWIAGVHSFGVYAGLVSSSAGATQSSDGGVITPTGKSVAIGSVLADAPTLNVDYSFTSASLAAGTVRRTAWPWSGGSLALITSPGFVGWLDEVTVIPFLHAAEGPALIEGTARFAWDYSYTWPVGSAE